MEFADYLADLCARYPIVSVEDGMSEDDWDGWATLTARFGGSVQLVGDDVFVTNSERLGRGTDAAGANRIPIKVDQIGSVPAAPDPREHARQAPSRRGTDAAPGGARGPEASQPLPLSSVT